jgi:hypothetical protein
MSLSISIFIVTSLKWKFQADDVIDILVRSSLYSFKSIKEILFRLACVFSSVWLCDYDTLKVVDCEMTLEVHVRFVYWMYIFKDCPIKFQY